MYLHWQRQKAKQPKLDLAHSPIQFADPEICTNFDFDRKMALETRKNA
jgi:hypothetical protein